METELCAFVSAYRDGGESAHPNLSVHFSSLDTLTPPTGEVLFLVDDKAEPVIISKQVSAPLPLRFFPLLDDGHLLAHVELLKEEEEQKCKSIYQGNLEGVEVTVFFDGKAEQ